MAKFLKKEVGNANINISMTAIKAGTTLATGMRKAFATCAKDLIGVILLKFKEKRPMMLDEINKFLDASLVCTNLEELSTEFIPCINNPAPGVKTGTIKFVEKAALVTYIDVL